MKKYRLDFISIDLCTLRLILKEKRRWNGREMKWNFASTHREFVWMFRESAACLPVSTRQEKKAEWRDIYILNLENLLATLLSFCLPFFFLSLSFHITWYLPLLNAITPKGNYIVLCIYINVNISFCIIWGTSTK